MNVAGLILAGGQGRRLGGQDKALIQLAGRPLLRHVIDRFGPQVSALAIAAGADRPGLSALGAAVLPDPAGHVGDGPLAGLLAGLDWAGAAGASHLVTVPVDLPFLPCDLVPCLLAGADGGAAFAESLGRDHPTAALWPVSLANPLRRALALGMRRVKEFAIQHHAVRVNFPAGSPDPFLNINTPEDLQLAEQHLAGRQ